MNHQSSRSHAIFRLKLVKINSDYLLQNHESSLFETFINFVDLAGSEKMDQHNDLRIISLEDSCSEQLRSESTNKYN